MKFSTLTERIADDGVDAWQVHYDAVARKEAGEDIILLSVGQETEQFTAPPIVAAAVDSLRAGRHHYTPVDGLAALRAAVAAHHSAATGQEVTADRCAIFGGAQNALYAVAQCVLEHGDEVILSEPYYTAYPATFTAGGARMVSVPTTFADGFQLHPEAILARITRRTRAIVLNSPNNPVGAVYTRAQYAPLVAACVRHGIWLITDDVYRALLPPEQRAGPYPLPGAAEVCVSVSSLSKSHRMTGWRLGWVVGPRPLMGHLYNLAMCMSYGLPAFIQEAALAALADGDAAAALRDQLAQRRHAFLTALGDPPGLQLFSAAGMFVVLNIGDLPVSARAFARGLLQAHGVAVLPCDGFGDAGRHLLRVSLCVEAERMATAAECIAAYVRCYPPAAEWAG